MVIQELPEGAAVSEEETVPAFGAEDSAPEAEAHAGAAGAEEEAQHGPSFFHMD